MAEIVFVVGVVGLLLYSNSKKSKKLNISTIQYKIIMD